jgi:UDP-N-acetylglucosamine--N-acetylmuramyl-(pentapeptide) pyrophosphoryl-undecaprenol N-acetylglucosamine transferase
MISERKVDAEASSKYADFDFVVIPAIAKPPTLSPGMLPFLWRLWRTVRRCRAVLRERKVDAVLGMGGFTSLPPVYAGHRMGLPTFVHDSNAMPGKANVLTSRFCTKVLVGLEEAQVHFPRAASVVTGTPVRSEMKSLPSREEALGRLGLPAGRKTVLVFGGSQGARNLNSLVVDAAAKAGDAAQWLHVAGTADAERVETLTAERGGHRVFGFFSEMPMAYAAADLAVCRSGGSSLSELSFLGVPAVLVPYPYAADDHQTRNAEAFVASGGAVMVQERDLDADRLAGLISGLLDDDGRLATMSRGMRRLSHDDAAGEIVDVVEASSAR